MTSASPIQLPNAFRKAEKKGLKGKIALFGASGSGKTWTALEIGSMLGRVAVLDTENSSSELYSDHYDFDVMPISAYTTDHLINAIRLAEDNRYNVLIIDSYSHFWEGNQGILQVQEATTASLKGDSLRAWNKVTPMWQRQKDAILQAKIHIIVTLRTKNNWEHDDSTGKTKHRIVGVKPVQKDGLEYEFTMCAQMTHNGGEDVNLTVIKSRCPDLHGAQFVNPKGTDFAPFFEWLGMKKNKSVPAPAPQMDIPPNEDFNLESDFAN